jgi:AcrR family transcriptional regulator
MLGYLYVRVHKGVGTLVPKTSRHSTAGGLSRPDRGVDRILRAARKVFVRDGGASFSARGVAKEAGVSLGAVQHFFRTTDELLAATMEHVLDDFRSEYDRLQNQLPFDAEARLLGAVDILIEDVWRQDSRRFFFDLYALSGHNEFAQKLVNDVYAHHLNRLGGYLGAARPHLSEQQCRDLALQIGAMIDGLMIYTGPGSKAIRPRSRLATLVKTTVLRLIEPWDVGSRESS